MKNLRYALLTLGMLLATTAPAETILEEKALSIRRGFANWWRHDHVTILGRSFDMSLFAAGLGLCALAGVAPPAISAVVVAALIRGKDVAEALKAAAEILSGPDSD